MSHFPLSAFKIYSMPLAFTIFTMTCLFVDLFAFILWVCWASLMCNVFQYIWQVISSNTFFCSCLCLLSWYSHCVCVGVLILSHISLSVCLFFFILFFSLLFRLYNLYQSILNFANYIFCLFKSTADPLQWIFHFSYWNFQLQNFHLVPFIIYSSLLILSTCCNIVIIPSTMSLIIVSF